ncbi:Cygnin [Aix galericulata]|nr:Cygnin [Aix galericulata]
MRFLCLVFAVFLLISLAAPGNTGTLLTPALSLCFPLAGYGQVRKYCPKVGYCSSKCSKADVWSLSSDCKFYCCLPPGWKGK